MRILIILSLYCSLFCSQTILSPYSDTLKTNAVELFIADSLFIAASSHLTFLNYDDCNNCALRAHVMSFIFSKLFPEIKTGKVWLFADSKLSSRRDYYKTHRKEFLRGNKECPQWGFHVAPVLLIGSDTIVIDPSTQIKPVKLGEWTELIAKNIPGCLVFKKSVYYTYPDDEYGLFDDKEDNWNLKYQFSSLESEINFLALKLTTAYHIIFDPLKFNYYKYTISKIINGK